MDGFYEFLKSLWVVWMMALFVGIVALLFGLCFLPTLVVYYPLFIVGLEQAKDGLVPPYGVWLGNLILAGIGILLIARVRRY